MITDKRQAVYRKNRMEKRAKKNVHDHSATSGKRKVFYTIACPIHGKKYAHSVEAVVMVSRPETARQGRRQGCPMCATEVMIGKG